MPASDIKRARLTVKATHPPPAPRPPPSGAAMSQIAVWRSFNVGVVGYWHHGILCPDGTVIHYKPQRPSTHKNKHTARIVRTSLRVFKGRSPHVYDVVHRGEPVLPPAEVARRAESKLGEMGYDLFENNCETFARWCVTGTRESRQIRSLRRGAKAGVPGLVFSALSLSLGDCYRGRMVRWSGSRSAATQTAARAVRAVSSS